MSSIKGRTHLASIIVAVVALVAALGGGAVAGVTISKLSKKEKKQVKQIAERKAKKLDRKIALTPGPRGERGPQGIPGAQGPEGDPAGASAVARFETSQLGQTPPSGLAQATAICNAGEVAVGGGGSFVSGTDAVGDQMSFSVPTGPGGSPVADGNAPVGWRAKGKNTSNVNLTWRTYVLCVKANPTRGG